MSKNYLYGASVQGIQSFIFKTDKLKEIIGASEMVQYISTKLYTEILGKNDYTIIQNAAGNIRLLLDIEQCKLIVNSFPKKVMEYAPGITISQAVVSPEEMGNNIQNKLNLLENRLQTQRNKSSFPLEIGYMGIRIERRTSELTYKKVDYKNEESEYLSESSLKKREILKENFDLLELIVDSNFIDKEQASKLTDELSIGENSFVAVIHADGNGLGNFIQNMEMQFKDSDDFNFYKEFSEKLRESTIVSAKNAFKEVADLKGKLWQKLPIRPIVMGGDDLTVIIQADMALSFVENYLVQFKKNSKNNFECNDGLTACAGIAFVKDKFPLHYAIDLAEQLCKEAKNHTKRLDSGISFFKVQDSYVGDLDKMRKRVQIRENIVGKPYNLQELTKLNSVLNAFNDNSDETKSGVSKLRDWITELSINEDAAEFKLNRIKSVNSKIFKDLFKDSNQKSTTQTSHDTRQIIYDAMQIHTIR